MAAAPDPERGLSVLTRLLERLTALAAPHHRELMRGMVSELESIADPAERRRFALGGVAAVVRLALRRSRPVTAHASGRFIAISPSDAGDDTGGPSMPAPAIRKLLLRHVAAFTVPFAVLTVFLLTHFAVKQVPQLSARGVTTGTVVDMLLLAVPFVVAMTIPMAVFIAVAWVFARLGAEGVLAEARREPGGVRRLVTPVLGAAAGVAALMLVSNTLILPRANERLAAVLTGAPRAASDRTMTITELRDAARNARTDTRPGSAERAVAYEVELQKKFALAAACVILALAAAAIALRFPRGGARLVIGASGAVFGAYYVALVAGEWLADSQVISPFVAMWMANALLLAAAMLLVRRRGSRDTTSGADSLAIGA